MWCPLGEELLDEGYVAGVERLGKVVSFLAVQDLTCVEDFIGAWICVHKNVLAGYDVLRRHP